MFKRMTIAIILLAIVFGAIFGWDILRTHFIKKFEKNFKPPPATIATTTAKIQSWRPTLTAVGSLTAVNGVNVTSEVTGIVIAIHFKSGQLVEKGQSLVQLDDSTDVQDLKNNQAELELAHVEFVRNSALLKTRAVSRSVYDQSLATLKQARAAVNKSLVAISKKNIQAPFTGKIGIRQINLGQYINPGDALVSLQSLDPLYIDFSLPEKYLQALHLGQRIAVETDAYPHEKFYGKITAINALVTEATRSIEVQGTLPNPEYRLYPGAFANVQVYLPTEKSVVTVPQTAVTYSLYGNVVYVVTQQGKDKKGQPIWNAYQRYVKIGPMKSNVAIIRQGIKAGETIVIAGQNKLQNGEQVVVNNSVKLQPQPTETLIGH